MKTTWEFFPEDPKGTSTESINVPKETSGGSQRGKNNTSNKQQIDFKNNTFKLGMHNIRGINKTVDQNNLLQEIKDEKIDILGLSETKLTQEVADFTFKNQDNYKVFHSCNNDQPYGSGVSILVHKKLERNIYRVERIEGYVLTINFLFKGKKRLCLIQVYLPNDQKRSKEVQKQIKKHIREGKLNDANIVVMGDFNATNNPLEDRASSSRTPEKQKIQKGWQPEISLFPFLEDIGLIDIHKYWEEITSPYKQISHTWKNKRSSSRIDYIWISQNMANNVHSFENKSFEHVTNSDHTLLMTTIYSQDIINASRKAEVNRWKSRTIYDYKKMDQDKWIQYAQKIEKEMIKNKVADKIQMEQNRLSEKDNNQPDAIDQEQLQKIWDMIESTIKKTANNILPRKKIKRAKRPLIHNRGHTPTFKDLREATMIASAIKKVQKETSPKLIDLITKKAKRLKRTQPLLDFEDFIKIPYKQEIPWKELEVNIKEKIRSIKEVNYREESVIKEKEIKKAISERCKNLESDQKKMINSLTNTRKKTITLDRIIVKDQQNPYIATEPEEVLNEVEKHYKNSFKTRNASFDLLNKKWKKEYQPKKEIKENWYKSLMDLISEEEFNIALKDLPNGKASGISTISYEMLKKLGSKTKAILRKFFSLCLYSGSCPQSWKTSTIYPIPKSKDWECDLTNTRPIILLETSRKLLTKIFTNRLSNICKKNKILQGPNYAGLQGESTQEPIQLLNNICEEAREKGKELWICFQDTAKAFDTVNLTMLQKAMERIKIPDKAIRFIVNLFENRKLRAITKFGLSQEIKAGDGLDQGETISPLLWRIFYDPLLSKIQNNKKFGYEMETTWQPDLNHPKKEKMNLRIAATAFMDDTTWLASSKSNMQMILDDAAVFYEANDSQVNGKKSVLIAINSKEEDQDSTVFIGPKKECLIKTETNEFARFLGIWLGEKDHKNYTIDLMTREIFQVTHALKKKKATDKQILYIFNRVLIPRLEYRSQHTYLQEKECKSLTAKYMGKFKNAINISKTCPNSIILHKGFYGLKSVEEIQKEALISNLTNRLNDTGPMGISTKIRLKDAQIKNWEPDNILVKYTPYLLKMKGNFQANVLALAHKMGIKYLGSDLSQLFEWKGGHHTIKNIIQNQKTYKKTIKNLSRNNIMYLDQIIDNNNNRLISWQILTSLLNRNNKGRTPAWFRIVRQKITNIEDNRLKEEYSKLYYVDNQYKWTDPVTQDSRKKERVVFRSISKGIQLGKIEKKTKENERIKYIVRHLVTTKSSEEQFILAPCGGCEISTENTRRDKEAGSCILEIKRGETRGIKYLNKRRMGRQIFPYNYEAFINNIKKEWLSEDPTTWNLTQQMPSIPIEDLGISLIKKWIAMENYKNQLITNYKTNLKAKAPNRSRVYEFYSDGSLKDRGNANSLMGSAWIQTAGINMGASFQCGVKNWPSSSKAEAIAIFTALLTVPESSTAKIFTDSQTCIDTLDKINNPHPKFTKRKLLKIKNWSIWIKIKETIQSKGLIVKLKKVKAHNGDFFNERVDSLAKEALKLEALEIMDCESGPINAIPSWNDITVDTSTREFLKEINKKEINQKWSEQNRNANQFRQEIINEDLFEWEAIWKKQNGKKYWTTPKDSQSKAFWIKLAQNELPTLENLAKRRPEIYGNRQRCILCNTEKESVQHLFTCIALRRELAEVWSKTEENLLRTRKKDQEIDQEKDQEKKKEIIKKVKEKTRSSPQNFFSITIGLFDKKEVNEAKEYTGWSRSKCSDFITTICDQLRKQFFDTIWKKRCEEIINWERSLGITTREKKKKKTKSKETRQRERNGKERNLKRPSQFKSSLVQEEEENQETGSKIMLVNKIRSWIQYGKKWLGM